MKALLKACKYSPIRDICISWAKLNFVDVLEEWGDILGQQLNGNSLIKSHNKPIFAKEFMDANVNRVLDIVHPTERRLLTVNELRQKYNFDFMYIDYFRFVAALPTTWKVEIRQNQVTNVEDFLPRAEILTKSAPPSRYVYWKLIENQYPPSTTSKTIWEFELNKQFSEEQWWGLFINFLKIVKPTKLRYMQYRILTKSLTTNYRRNKWNTDISPLCSFCANVVETTRHVLYECSKVYILWETLKKWCKHFLQIEIDFTLETVILNNYIGKHKVLVNTFIIIMKQYVYASKCKGNIPNFGDYVSKLSYWYLVDKEIAQKNDKQKIFEKKWCSIF